jgi:hypothetical protein
MPGIFTQAQEIGVAPALLCRIPAGSDSSENRPVGKRGRWFSRQNSKTRLLTQPMPLVIRKSVLFLPTVEPDL